MKILIVEPSKAPQRADIPHTLEDMQRTVGGCIQAVYPWDDPVALVCDEEGLINGKTLNRYIVPDMVIAGTFFICGLDEEDFADLPDELAEKYEKPADLLSVRKRHPRSEQRRLHNHGGDVRSIPMNHELNERLKAFLRDPQRRELRFRDGEWEKLLIRCPYDDDTDFLYLATAYKGRSPHQIGEDAKYAGIYSRLCDRLSDVCYSLANIAERQAIGKAALLRGISETASAMVLEIVGRQLVEETEDAEHYWITKEYFLAHELERQALQHFYNRTQPEFAPKVNIESMTTEEYVHALNHPEEAAERLACAYIRSKAIFHQSPPLGDSVDRQAAQGTGNHARRASSAPQDRREHWRREDGAVGSEQER